MSTGATGTARASRRAVEYLAQLGHRRFGYISGTPGTVIEAERFRGFLEGIAAVGLTWKEIDVKPEQQQVQISYTKDQLKAAPDFKTTEQINSEMNAQQQAAPPTPAPAPSTGGTTTNP